MKCAKIFGVVLGLLLALVVAAPMAHADMANQLTKLVFNKPVQIPGNKVLPAGTYWFRIASFQDSNTVMIYNARQSKLEAIVETRPTLRTKKIGHIEVSLAEGRSPQQPATLTRWFYPGMEYGHAFIYSRRTENRINHEIARNIIVQPTTSVG